MSCFFFCIVLYTFDSAILLWLLWKYSLIYKVRGKQIFFLFSWGSLSENEDVFSSSTQYCRWGSSVIPLCDTRWPCYSLFVLTQMHTLWLASKCIKTRSKENVLRLRNSFLCCVKLNKKSPLAIIVGSSNLNLFRLISTVNLLVKIFHHRPSWGFVLYDNSSKLKNCLFAIW